MSSMIVDHRNVSAAFRRLSIPVAVAMLGDQLLGVADTIAIGSLGTLALAGATAANTVFLALAMGSSGLLTGMSIIAAQRIGADDTDGFARTVRAGILAPALIGALCTVAAVYGSHPLIGALVGHLASAPASAVYLILRAGSLIPIAISGAFIVGLGAAGNRQLGVLVLLVINAIHIPLLLILGLGWLTHHPLGIVGAGISSLLSESIGAVVATVYVARRPVYRVFAQLSFSVRLAWESTRLGLPEVVFLLGVMLPDVFIVAMLAPLGPAIVAGFRALNVVSDLTFVVPSPLQSAAQTVIGQRLGAADVTGARIFLRHAQRVSMAITLVAGALVALFAWPLAYVFTLNAMVASLAALPLALHMVTLPIKGWAMVSLAPIRAAGDTRFSMIVGIACSVLVIPFAWVGIERLHIGLFSIPLGWIAAWSLRALLTMLRLRDDDWTRRAPLAA